MMRYPKTRDDWWYTRKSDSEIPKVYAYCPRCGMKCGIDIRYTQKFCYMCGEVIYANAEENEKSRKKIEFKRKLERKLENAKNI